MVMHSGIVTFFLRAECPVTATGVCTPGVEETIVITETESIEYEADGHTVTTTDNDRHHDSNSN